MIKSITNIEKCVAKYSKINFYYAQYSKKYDKLNITIHTQKFVSKILLNSTVWIVWELKINKLQNR